MKRKGNKIYKKRMFLLLIHSLFHSMGTTTSVHQFYTFHCINMPKVNQVPTTNLSHGLQLVLVFYSLLFHHLTPFFTVSFAKENDDNKRERISTAQGKVDVLTHSDNNWSTLLSLVKNPLHVQITRAVNVFKGM